MGSSRPSGVFIQQRDIDIFLGLFESRVAQINHLSLLYFDGNIETAKKRLQKLKRVDFIVERPRTANASAVLQLGKAGFECLQNRGLLGSYPRITWLKLQRRLQVSDLTLTHELQVMGVKALMTHAIKQTKSLRVVNFSTWPALHEFKVRGRKGPVKPDGYLHICEKPLAIKPTDHRFFLEIDCSTESQKVLVTKCHDYLNHYRLGGFAASQGAAPTRYKEVPFRVLMICETPQRRDNLAVRLVMGKPTIRGLVWLTTMKELEAAPLGEIWVTPGMYQPWPGASDSAMPPANPVKLSLFSDPA